MGTENGETVDIDAVVINTHGNPYELGYGNNSDDSMTSSDIQELDNKDVGTLVLYGCNAGHADFVGTNPASEFSRKVNGAPVVASDGTVKSGWSFLNLSKRKFRSEADDVFRSYFLDGVERDNLGWLIYRSVDDNITVSESLGLKLHLTAMLEECTE